MALAGGLRLRGKGPQKNPSGTLFSPLQANWAQTCGFLFCFSTQRSKDEVALGAIKGLSFLAQSFQAHVGEEHLNLALTPLQHKWATPLSRWSEPGPDYKSQAATGTCGPRLLEPHLEFSTQNNLPPTGTKGPQLLRNRWNANHLEYESDFLQGRWTCFG